MDHNLGFAGQGDFHIDTNETLIRRGQGQGPLYAYAGVQVMHPRVLTGKKEIPFSTNQLWDDAISEGRLTGQVMDAFWMHVGDPQARDATENQLALLET